MAAVKRLNKAAWLERAVDQGWLERIEAWVEEDFVRAITGWNAPVSKIPLHVAVAPQVGNDILLKILQLPQLQGLVLPSNVLANEAAKEVAACTNLRDLTVQFRLVDASIVDAILARIISMPMLRRLCIKGHERPDHSARPSDQDLVLLGKLQTLKQLNLSSCSTVTDVGIAELQRVNPTLIISRNYEP